MQEKFEKFIVTERGVKKVEYVGSATYSGAGDHGEDKCGHDRTLRTITSTDFGAETDNTARCWKCP